MVQRVLKEKSYLFSVRIVKLTQYLTSTKQEYVLSKQTLRSGTAIGALIREAEFAQSNADYINKFSVALKEANETKYWIELLKDTDYIEEILFKSLFNDVKEIIAILVSTIKTLKKK
ncbi:MAG: four helix bundle protein [Bacteroidota bacterium]|nr:four helix bundle protein [Bacteroidota bacterium]